MKPYDLEIPSWARSSATIGFGVFMFIIGLLILAGVFGGFVPLETLKGGGLR